MYQCSTSIQDLKIHITDNCNLKNNSVLKYQPINKKLYKCSMCDKQFINQFNFTQHVIMHKPPTNKCPYCDKHFVYQFYLRRHIKTHITDKLHKCGNCGKWFEKQNDLENHKQIHLGVKYECPECDKCFIWKSNWTKHVKTHALIDNIKSQSVKNEASLEVKKEHDTQLINKETAADLHKSKTVYMTNTLHTIAQEKQIISAAMKYECHECNKCFTMRGNLIKHMMIHAYINDIKRRSFKNNTNAEHVLRLLEVEVKKTHGIKLDVVANLFNNYPHTQSTVKCKKKYVDKEFDVCKEKLKSKEEFVRNQLDKFAASVKRSYPISIQCTLDTSKQVDPIDEEENDVWKFTCRQILIKDLHLPWRIKKSLVDFPDGKIRWALRFDDSFSFDVESDSSYPPFMMHIMKVFKDFLQVLPKHENEFSYKDDFHDENKLLMNITMQANSADEVTAFMNIHSSSSIIKDKLHNFLLSRPINSWNLKSVYCKTANLETELLYGVKRDEEFQSEIFSNLKVPLNLSSIEALTSTIDNYLTPCHATTLLEIGCGNGMIGLLLAPKCKKVIGLDCSSEIKIAEEVCRSNNIENATYEKDELKNVERLFNRLQHCDKVTAIVNHSASCGLSITTMEHIQKLRPLNSLVIVTAFTDKCFPSLLTLMVPVNDIVNSSFTPVQSCIVDTMPGKSGFHYVLLMERRELPLLLETIKEEPIEENYLGSKST